MSELRDRLIKNSTIELTATLTDSKIYSHKDVISTSVPMINVALSGSVDGGITPGLTMIAGPSRHFKTGFALLMIASFLKKYDDAVILFYDSEFGTPQSYFKSYGINFDQVIHTPVTNVEELKFDIVQQLESISRKDHVMIVVDSIGNLASKKEVEDAKDQKSVADMTRAKAIKSLLRIISPHLTLRDIPMIVVNHTYAEQTMYPRQIMSGGCVVAGTNIIMADWSIKPIEDVNVGEEVLTINGPQQVTHTWNPETLENGETECYEIEFEDGYKVICSSEHAFYIKNNDDEWQWVEATHLNKDDLVMHINKVC